MADQELPTTPPAGHSGKAIASMALGISGIVLFCLFPPLAVPVGAAGLVLGFMSLKSQSRGFAIAGLVTSGISLLLGLLLVVGIAFLYFMGNDEGQAPFDYSLF